MKLLLDTHTLIWAGGSSSRLPKHVAEILLDPNNDLFVSAATYWEIVTKYTLGKLPLPVEPRIWIGRVEDALGADRLAIECDHALEAKHLPPHHRDPFDRILICQARVEGLTLVTDDAQIRKYDVATLW